MRGGGTTWPASSFFLLRPLPVSKRTSPTLKTCLSPKIGVDDEFVDPHLWIIFRRFLKPNVGLDDQILDHRFSWKDFEQFANQLQHRQTLDTNWNCGINTVRSSLYSFKGI